MAYPEMYMLGGPPFRLGKCKRGRPVVIDRDGEEVGLLGDAWCILTELATDDKWAGVQIAYVSRTDEPQWANKCLQMLQLDSGLSLHALAHHHEIYPGSKKTHFRRIHERTKVPYADMLFLDDMQWNIQDVESMGVCAVYTPRGLTADAWQKALTEYAKRRSWA
ncbi:hypothetical protein CHLNCDRAFT_138712 [Chlorella variabilis]|uniref:Magnesium-dependent phosphatase-1 n=1 Tax=Chlorella variabilis TaxID=554065 RepID=E1ZNL5_CHLVA|nr:hypothetical protein CHLNCDRAFT_138712 [Chlorella variabilis]EFN52625.1 hypothetical protein CHLNCDRAFT_138712 [Chlorella variabilis]|eukprot:XP_005844727.1 hypothetical protein CHLNCDRAFT_138712 [Chlorella variabilis]